MDWGPRLEEGVAVGRWDVWTPDGLMQCRAELGGFGESCRWGLGECSLARREGCQKEPRSEWLYEMGVGRTGIGVHRKLLTRSVGDRGRQSSFVKRE